LNASYALEAIRFMVSFATSLGMVENKLFIGNGNIITSILQDEMLHTDWTAYIINQVVKDDPRFARAKLECKDEVAQLYRSVIEEEKGWADYLFREGVVIGLNANILKSFVDFTSSQRLKDIGIKYLELYPTLEVSKTSPLPWFNNHTDTTKKQTALQENESTSYVIGAMSGAVNYGALPDL
jgi:ribonucleoside-diphosphate reductase beta chain